MTTNYARISSIALDPIEKKPLYRFFPGSRILSLGSIDCNMRCPFCQNHRISRPEGSVETRILHPEEVLELSLSLVEEGNIGVAFTYNEPLMTFDFVRDCGRLLKEAGQKCVVVTNGCFGDKVLDEVLPVVDAFNIDLKAFTEEGYSRLGGDLNRVKHFIERASTSTHVEITSLIVPGLNDDIGQIEEEAIYLSGVNPNIPLHITRFFPNYKMTNSTPTDILLMEKMQSVAGKYLKWVYLGNV